jgi:formate-dependent nitrite reductase membrane component NrfD
MYLETPAEQKYDKPSYGAAHLRPRDAYKDVPILKAPTWRNEVAAYFFFGGVSAGAALIGSLAEVFGGERRKGLARTAHYVSFAALLPCPPLLVDDLGMPSRFHHMLRIFKPSSPMNLGSWALVLHGAGATLTVMRMLAADGKLPVPLVGGLLRLLPERLMAGLGIPSSFLLAGYTGVLLGTTSIPVWYTSPILGGLFMSSSLAGGAAATGLARTWSGQARHEEHQALATLGVTLGAAELALLGGYVATSGEAAKPFTTGTEGALILGATALLASAVLIDAATLITGKRSKATSTTAGLAALAGGAILRWAIVRAGRVSSQDREGTLEAMQPRHNSPGWRVPAKS